MRTDREISRLAARFKALGDATRLSILGLLRDSEDSLCACEIEASFDLAQPTISHHLRQLRATGLVNAERRGNWIHYRLSADGLAATENFLRELQSEQGVTS